MNKYLFFIVALIMLADLTFSQQTSGNQRRKNNFNSRWELHVGDFNFTLYAKGNTSVIKTGSLKETFYPTCRFQ